LLLRKPQLQRSTKPNFSGARDPAARAKSTSALKASDGRQTNAREQSLVMIDAKRLGAYIGEPAEEQND
jgi:hypothetical protein